MPLNKSKSDKAREQNIREMIAAGHPVEQAVAAGYDVQRRARKKAKPKVRRKGED
jgi:hypothetical protein